MVQVKQHFLSVTPATALLDFRVCSLYFLRAGEPDTEKHFFFHCTFLTASRTPKCEVIRFSAAIGPNKTVMATHLRGGAE